MDEHSGFPDITTTAMKKKNKKTVAKPFTLVQYEYEHWISAFF